jgi:hypothetical protein
MKRDTALVELNSLGQILLLDTIWLYYIVLMNERDLITHAPILE